MSTYVMAACWPIQIPPTPKAVLISLADNANDHGYCWPSIATISTRTCFGKTAVIEAIRWLEEHGLVVADRENGRHTKYQIKPNGMTPELFDAEGNPSASRTSPGNGPVREANQSGKRTGSAGGPDLSASRTRPVRQADTNRQEPTRTKEGEARSPSGSRLPPDWEPFEADIEFAKTKRPDLDWKAEAEKFRDYWRGVAGADARRADWPATWRNWIRRADAPKGSAAAEASTSPAPPARDWREPSESPIEREISYIRQQHNYGTYGDGPEADAKRDRLIAEAKQKHAAATEGVPA